jgi:hypothetical protein
MNYGPRLELTQIKCLEIETAPRLRVSFEQYLKTAIQQEPIDRIGADPSTNLIGCFQHLNRESAPLKFQRRHQARDAGTHHQDIGMHTNPSLREAHAATGQRPEA